MSREDLSEEKKFLFDAYVAAIFDAQDMYLSEYCTSVREERSRKEADSKDIDFFLQKLMEI